MNTVRDMLEVKGHDVWSISPNASVYEALKRMADKDVGALAVLEENKLVGILSERDYARKVILQGTNRLGRATLLALESDELAKYLLRRARKGRAVPQKIKVTGFGRDA